MLRQLHTTRPPLIEQYTNTDVCMVNVQEL